MPHSSDYPLRVYRPRQSGPVTVHAAREVGDGLTVAACTRALSTSKAPLEHDALAQVSCKGCLRVMSS